MNIVAISAESCQNWMIFDLACCISNLTSVTLNDQLNDDCTEYILKQCEIKTLFCELKQVEKYINLKLNKELRHLQNLVLIDEVSIE